MLGMDVGNSVVFYVVYVSRSRIGLYVSYVHVESIDSLWRNLEHVHLETITDGACAVRKERQIRGVTIKLNKTRPHHPHLN